MSIHLIEQIVQMVAAMLILVAFASAQAGKWATSSRRYLALNLVGSAILTVLAFRSRDWGFFVLEFAWAGISGFALLRKRPRPGM